MTNNPTSNPASDTLVTDLKQEDTSASIGGDYERFHDLASKLFQVPKEEISGQTPAS